MAHFSHVNKDRTDEWVKAQLSEPLECPLCPSGTIKRLSITRLRRHLIHGHINYGINLHGSLLLPCRLGCDPEAKGKRPHYHCLCNNLLSCKQNLVKHINLVHDCGHKGSLKEDCNDGNADKLQDDKKVKKGTKRKKEETTEDDGQDKYIEGKKVKMKEEESTSDNEQRPTEHSLESLKPLKSESTETTEDDGQHKDIEKKQAKMKEEESTSDNEQRPTALESESTETTEDDGQHKDIEKKQAKMKEEESTSDNEQRPTALESESTETTEDDGQLKHVKKIQKGTKRKKEVSLGEDDIEGKKARMKDEESTSENKQRPTALKAHLVECPHCGKVMSDRSIFRHVRDQHQGRPSEPLLPGKEVCKTDGLYLIAKSHTGGHFPIHVQLKTSTEEQKIFCEDGRCQAVSEAYGRSGVPSYMCPHLTAALKAEPEQAASDISSVTLATMLKQKIISRDVKKRIEGVLEQTKSTPVVMWEVRPGSRYIFFSVVASNKSRHGLFGRVVVTLNKVEKHLKCPCMHSRRRCIHTRLVQCYLHANDLQKHLSSTEADHSLNEGARSLRRYIQYLLDTKSIASDIISQDHLPLPNDELCATESTCPLCPSGPRLNKVLLSKVGKIYDVDNIKTGIKVYGKECQHCSIVFRYKEHKDGLFNYNDRIILTLKLCLFLRAAVQHETAVGRIGKILTEVLGQKYPQELLDAYLAFECLVQREYSFYCVQCGYYPSLLVLDGNHKIAFNLDAEVLHETSDCVDLVNVGEYWQDVQYCCIAQGLVPPGKNPFHFEPNYKKWAPWIGPETRGSSVLNTEHRKIKVDTEGKAKKDGTSEKELNSELIEDLLFDSKAETIRETAEELGVSSVGSKMDIMRRLMKKFKGEGGFMKEFLRLRGKSGGIVVACCTHGIVYAMKSILRAESVRDHVDILMSLKHFPTVVISDIASLTAAHGNNREANLFDPHAGRLAEPTTTALEQVKNKQFKRSLPYLVTSKYKELSPHQDHLYASGPRIHPVTQTADRFALSDEFHKWNSSDRKDRLRHITLVPELQGKVNTQVCEELFSVMDRDIYFLNSMTPMKHMITLRLLLDLKNRERNNEALEEIKKRIGKESVIVHGPDGRVAVKERDHKESRIDGDPQLTNEVEVTMPNEQPPQSRPTCEMDEGEMRGVVGLVNTENNCWLNSSIQALKHVLSATEIAAIMQAGSGSTEAGLLQVLGKLLQSMGSSKEPIKPEEMMEFMVPRNYTRGQQHDAMSFVIELLGALESCGILQPFTIRQEKQCRGHICSQDTDKETKIIPSTEQLILQLAKGDGQESVKDCVEEYFKDTVLSDENACFCERCQTNETCVIKSRLVKKPAILVLEVKRGMSVGQGKLVKNNSLLKIDRTLTIEGQRYDLECIQRSLSVLQCHSGQVTSGHYWTVLINGEEAIEMNDQVVKRHRLEHLDTELLRRSTISLWYRRMGNVEDTMYTDRQVTMVETVVSKASYLSGPNENSTSPAVESETVINERAPEGSPSHDKVINERAPEGIPSQDKVINERAPEGSPSHDKVINERAPEGSPSHDKVINERAPEGSPSQDKVLRRNYRKKLGRLGQPIPTHCLCRSSDESGFYIQCDVCDKWYHPACVKLAITEAEAKRRLYYVCPQCTGKSRIWPCQSYRQYCKSVPLTLSKKVWINDATDYNKAVINIEGFSLSRRDLLTVEDKWSAQQIHFVNDSGAIPGWINDNIINAFFCVVVRQANFNSPQSCACLDSFLWESLTSGREAHFKPDKTLAQRKKIYVPVHMHRSHWCLMTVAMKKKGFWELHFYDPAVMSAQIDVKPFIAYLASCGLDVNPVIQIEKGAMQKDTSSCGVLVCKKLLCSLLGTRMGTEEPSYFRKVIVGVLLLQGTLVSTSLDKSNASADIQGPIDVVQTVDQPREGYSSLNMKGYIQDRPPTRKVKAVTRNRPTKGAPSKVTGPEEAKKQFMDDLEEILDELSHERATISWQGRQIDIQPDRLMEEVERSLREDVAPLYEVGHPAITSDPKYIRHRQFMKGKRLQHGPYLAALSEKAYILMSIPLKRRLLRFSESKGLLDICHPFHHVPNVILKGEYNQTDYVHKVIEDLLAGAVVNKFMSSG